MWPYRERSDKGDRAWIGLPWVSEVPVPQWQAGVWDREYATVDSLRGPRSGWTDGPNLAEPAGT